MGCCASRCREQPQFCMPIIQADPCAQFGSPLCGTSFGGCGQMY